MAEPKQRPTYSRRLDEDELGAWKAFLRSHAAAGRRLEADLAAAGGLSVSEYDVLVTLLPAGERGLRMSELATSVLVTKSGITRLVDRLVEQGHVVRRPCLTDRRGQQAVLTARGRDALRTATSVHFGGVARRFAEAVGARNLRTVRAALERVLREFQ